MISVVIPVYNEEPNLRPLYRRLVPVLEALGRPWEVLFVDDGSRDGSARELKALADIDSRVRNLRLARNAGQSAALESGIRAARGDMVVTLDGDLQNDPADIPMLVAILDEGYDLVHGWRRERCDPLLRRRVPSVIANWLISRATGVPVHDLGCALRAMRRGLALRLELRRGLHRFIPILAHLHGARCVEVVVRHNPRRFGRSKYGLSRVGPVLRDLIALGYRIRASRRRPQALGVSLQRACES